MPSWSSSTRSGRTSPRPIWKPQSANIIVESAVMAPSAEAETQGGLRRRVVSALVLAPPVAAAVYFGMPYFELVVALAAVQMAREWERLCSEGGGQARITSVMAGGGGGTPAGARGLGHPPGGRRRPPPAAPPPWPPAPL